MVTGNAQEIIAAARKHLNTPSTVRYTPEMCLRELNHAQVMLCDSAEFPFLEYRDTTVTTVPNVSTVDLPDIVKVIKGVWLGTRTTDNQLMPLSDSQTDDALADVKGKPTHYHVFGGTLELLPTPSTAQTVIIDCLRHPPDITAETGVGSQPIVPRQYCDILALLLAGILRQSDGGSGITEGDAFFNRAGIRIIAMIKQLIPKHRDVPFSIRSTYDQRFSPRLMRRH